MAKVREVKKEPRCKVCACEDRAGIEMICLMSFASWNVARERVNNTFGTDFTKEQLKNHMEKHELNPVAMQQGILLESLRQDDGAVPMISPETMLQTLMVQGMLDLAKGHIRCKTPAELIAVTHAVKQLQDRRDAQLALETDDVQSFYRVMAAYGEAIRDTVSPEQMRLIVRKANALGAVMDIGAVPVETVVEVDPVDIMDRAVQDYKTLGRGRTRDELIEAGVLDDIDEQLDLPRQ